MEDFFVVGNCDVRLAEYVLFGELHTSFAEEFRRLRRIVFDRLIQPQDLIFREGYPCLEQCPCVDPGLGNICLGWDDPTVGDESNRVLARHAPTFAEIVRRQLPEVLNGLSLIGHKFGNAYQLLSDHEMRVFREPTVKAEQRATKVAQKLIAKLVEHVCGQPDSKTLNALARIYNKVFDGAVTPLCRQHGLIYNIVQDRKRAIDDRNEWLQLAMKLTQCGKRQDECRRKLFIAGLDHFFYFNKTRQVLDRTGLDWIGEISRCTEILPFLNDIRFVLLVPKVITQF